MSASFGGDLTHGQRQRIDPIAEPRRHLRPRREVIPVINVDRSVVGPCESVRRYVDQQAADLAADGYVQARALDLAAEREAVATDLGDHGCDRSTALHFAAIVVAGLVARGKL